MATIGYAALSAVKAGTTEARQVLAVGTTVAELQAYDPGDGTTPYSGFTEANQQMRAIDDGAANALDIDASGAWWWNGASGWTPVEPYTAAEQLQADIVAFRGVFHAEEGTTFQQLLARATVDPQTDSGHAWLDDMLHAWVKPWLRFLVVHFETEKARASGPIRANYLSYLAAFNRQAQTPGLLGFWSGADKAVWRPLRSGIALHEYDTSDGGTTGTAQAVSYPQGESVATWSARGAIDAL